MIQQERRVHEAMRKHGYDHPVSYHDGGAKVIRDGNEPRDSKSKLALHTNHNPGVEGTDEVMR